MEGAQELDPDLMKITNEIREGKETSFTLAEDGILHLDWRLCVPNDEEMRNQILSEAYDTPCSVHPGATKMYQGLEEQLW